jgi:hypothetical protein
VSIMIADPVLRQGFLWTLPMITTITTNLNCQVTLTGARARYDLFAIVCAYLGVLNGHMLYPVPFSHMSGNAKNWCFYGKYCGYGGEHEMKWCHSHTMYVYYETSLRVFSLGPSVLWDTIRCHLTSVICHGGHSFSLLIVQLNRISNRSLWKYIVVIYDDNGSLFRVVFVLCFHALASLSYNITVSLEGL